MYPLYNHKKHNAIVVLNMHSLYIFISNVIKLSKCDDGGIINLIVSETKTLKQKKCRHRIFVHATIWAAMKNTTGALCIVCFTLLLLVFSLQKGGQVASDDDLCKSLARVSVSTNTLHSHAIFSGNLIRDTNFHNMA